MLLTIHNLPSSCRYVDIKSLLEEKCGLTELILDNLVSEGNTKRVTVGVADEGDAAILVRKINGLYVQGLQLYVEDKRKKKESDQPYRSSSSSAGMIKEAQFQSAVNPHHNMMGDVMSNQMMSNPMMMNYNMLGMPMYMPMMSADQNMPIMGYGGVQAGSAAEAHPLAPVHNERGYAGLRGAGGAPEERRRDRGPERDSFRPSDGNRRMSPERAAEPFDRPSRWNDNPAPSDMPMRRDQSPPHQPWSHQESHAPLPPLRQPNLPGPRGRNRNQPRQPKPEYQRTDPQWEERSTRWDAEPNLQRPLEPNLQRRPEPDLQRRPKRNQQRRPEPNQQRRPETNLQRRPEPNLQRRPEPNLQRRPERNQQRRAEPNLQMRPERNQQRRAEPNLQRRPEPNLHMRPEPIQQRRAEPNLQRRPEPNLHMRPEPILQRRSEPEQEWGLGPNEDWQPEPIQPESRVWDEPIQPEPRVWDEPIQPGPRVWDEPNQFREQPDRQWEENLPRFDPQDDRRQFPEEFPLDQSRNEPNVHWNESGQSSDLNFHEGNDRWDRNLAPNSLGQNNITNRPEERGARRAKDWRDNKRPNPFTKTEPERGREPKNWKQTANDYPPAKKQKPDFPRREGFQAPRQRDNNGTQYAPIVNPFLPFRNVPEETYVRPAPVNPVPSRPITIKYLINKDQTVRGQATAILAKEALVGTKRTDQTFTTAVLKELKQCIKGRIEVMLGEELKTNFEEIIEAYRVKYPKKDDKHLYQTMRDRVIKLFKEEDLIRKKVVDNIKKEKEDKKKEQSNKKGEEGDKKEEEGNKKKEEQVKKVEGGDKKKEEVHTNKEEGKTAAVKVKAEPSDGPSASAKEKSTAKEKSPQRVLTDKQILREAKQQRKLEFTKEDYFKLDPLTDEALDEELDKLNEIFASECNDAQNDMDTAICSRITERSADELRKCIRLHVTKRVLNISTGLTIRIFGEGKLPRKEAVKRYLLKYRVDRLSKNKKGTMYVANIGRFEDYDALCRLENDVIDGIPIKIKSMHLVGPPPKLTKNQIRQRRKQIIRGQITDFPFKESTEVVAAEFQDFADIDIDTIRQDELEDF